MTILPANPAGYNLESINALMKNVVQLALSIAGGIAIIFIIWGAFQYFTAYGNEEKAQNGKKIITWAIIGLVVMILAKVIVGEIWGILSNQPPNFGF